MIGHQRDVLSALGIDIWIPKAVACQARVPTGIWRDQSTPESHIETVLAIPNPISPSSSVVAQPRVIEQAKPQPSQTAAAVPQLPHRSIEEVFHVESFSLQALQLNHCVLVIDAGHLTKDQQALWANIQRAGQAIFYELNWPFTWQQMQNGRGASSYARGFIDSMLMERNLLLLGDISHLQHEKAIQLASLQDMLDQPLLKKRLWQFMRSSRVLNA